MGVVFRPDPRRAARTLRSNTAPAMALVMRSIYDAKHPPGSGPILLPTSGRRTRRPWHRQNQPRYLLRLIQLGQICRLDAFEDFSDAGAHQAPYAGDAPAGEIGSQRTLRWREPDSNLRYRGRRRACGRSLRAQRVETDPAKGSSDQTVACLRRLAAGVVGSATPARIRPT